MFTVAVVLALVGALLIAVGAVLQERAAVNVRLSRGPLRFLVGMLHDPRWVLGAALAVAGVGTHVVALTLGPVSAIQPIGTAGLLFAVLIHAALDRRPVPAWGVLSSLAVMGGLAGLLLVLPHGGAGRSLLDVSPDTTAALAAATVIAVSGALLVGVRATPTGTKSVAFAAAAGIAFGVGAALISSLGHRMTRDPMVVLTWPAVLVATLLVGGGISQQHAYRMGHFPLAYAIILTTDPVVAATTGIVVLGEPMPSTTMRSAWMGVSGLAIVAGVLGLARVGLTDAPHGAGTREGESAVP